jgi:hypothetical protein
MVINIVLCLLAILSAVFGNSLRMSHNYLEYELILEIAQRYRFIISIILEKVVYSPIH